MRLSLALTVCALALAACQPNPLFELVTASQAATDEASSAETSADTGAADATAGGPPPTSTDGPPPSTTSDIPPDPTTGSVLPDTTTGATADATDTTADAASTSAAGTLSTGSSGDEPDSTSGDESTGQTTLMPVEDCPIILEFLYIPLYPRCASPNTQWTGMQNQAMFPVACDGMGAMGYADDIMMTENAEGDPICNVLELMPYQTVGGGIQGKFADLQLSEAQRLDAELVTEVSCTTQEQAGTCDLQVSIWASTGMEPELGKTSAQIKNGQVKPFKLPLYALPGVKDGQEFTVHLDVKVNNLGDAQDSAYFVDPRIRQKQG